jgi:hypothetical protein
MLLSVKQITKELLNDAAKKIVDNATSRDQNPSGRLNKAFWIKEIESESNYIATLYGSKFIYNALEIGRGKTKNSGDGSLRRNIEKWLEQRGKSKKLAYVIAKTIHEKGTLQGRGEDMRFGRPSGTITDIINQDFEKILLQKITGLVEIEIMKGFKND